MRLFQGVVGGAGYLKARAAERSTWASIAAAVAGAAALATPYSYLVIAAGVIGTLVPTSAPKQDN